MIKKRFFETVSNRVITSMIVTLAFFYFGFSLVQTQNKLESIAMQEMVNIYKLLIKMEKEHPFNAYFVENEAYEHQKAFRDEYLKMTPYSREGDLSNEMKYLVSVQFFTSQTLPQDLASQKAFLEQNEYTCKYENHVLHLFGKVEDKGFLWIKKEAKALHYIRAQFEYFAFFLGSLCLLSLGILYVGYREMLAYHTKKEILETEYLFLEEDAKRLAFVDTLTGVSTRLKLSQSLHDLIENAKRFVQPFSLIMFDLDCFKKINDTYGHDYGDIVLKTIAQSVKKSLRESDIIARWGGEEFVVVLPMTSLKSGIKTAEKLRRMASSISFDQVSQVTCSFGVVEYHIGESEEALFKRVDVLLYEAKTSGRNCIKYEKKVKQ